jgi:SAM-dependent methyltransferase
VRDEAKSFWSACSLERQAQRWIARSARRAPFASENVETARRSLPSLGFARRKRRVARFFEALPRPEQGDAAVNSSLPDTDPSILYNDSDYPSRDHARFYENCDAITESQGVAHDVDRYLELAKKINGPILEVGCGSGRVAIPLARAGHDVHAVDVSEGMLERLRTKLASEPEELGRCITIERADAREMELSRRGFALALMPFNTLSCIPDFDGQRAVLRRIAAHLRAEGELIVDLINPFRLSPSGDPVPKPFFTRRNEWTGRRYTRFAMLGPMDEHQRQELHGWYDEVTQDDLIERRYYSITWRPLYRFEIQLMLEEAGFTLETVEGGHHGEPFTSRSPKMFVRARRRAGGGGVEAGAPVRSPVGRHV